MSTPCIQTARIESIEETLNGNGKDGLKTEVALLKQAQASQHARLKRIENLAWGIIILVLTALVKSVLIAS